MEEKESKTYNRLCVSVSDETKDKLNSIVGTNSKKIRGITKSAVVELALVRFFESVNENMLVNELSKQLMVE